MAIATKELKRLRLSQNLTQKQLADSIDVSSARYSSWERGEKQPSSENIQKLAEKLCCTVSKLIVSTQDNQFDIEVFNDKHSEFSYFVNEQREEKTRTYDELILKLKLFDAPLIFQLSKESEEKSINSIMRGEYDFIWVETHDDKMLYINTDCIEWLICHDDGADQYPDICKGKFHYTPLLNADVTKSAVLFMMSKNGNNDSSNELLTDFEWLIQNQSRLIDETPKSIRHLKESLGKNYNNFLNDTENTQYEKKFIDAWGIRIFLKNGKDIFLPGMFSRGEVWDEVLIDIKNMNLYDDNHITDFSDYDNNRYIIPTKEIALIEYPNVFNAIANYAEYEKIVQIDYQEVDKTIEKLFKLVWS